MWRQRLVTLDITTISLPNNCFIRAIIIIFIGLLFFIIIMTILQASNVCWMGITRICLAQSFPPSFHHTSYVPSVISIKNQESRDMPNSLLPPPHTSSRLEKLIITIKIKIKRHDCIIATCIDFKIIIINFNDLNSLLAECLCLGSKELIIVRT